jgi:hypothetical protein
MKVSFTRHENASGGQFPLKKFIFFFSSFQFGVFFFANLGTSCIPYTVYNGVKNM